MNLPNEEIMRQMVKLALEQATTGIANMARSFADNSSTKGLTGEQALLAFADAIENTSAKQWPSGDLNA